MNYTTNMSRKERIFLDSSIIIGLFSDDDDAEKILGRIIGESLYITEFEIGFGGITEEVIEIASSLAPKYRWDYGQEISDT